MTKPPVTLSRKTSPRQPTIFVPHGGGPWPFVDLRGFVSQRDVEIMRHYFQTLPDQLPATPKALVVISAHWECPQPTVMTSPQPPLYYDYGGFPPEAYTLEWKAPGAPQVAERVVELLARAGIDADRDSERGFDHGTFIPFKVSWPQASIPTIQLSLQRGLDPERHLAIGRAIAPLRDEGVLILGSGMSYHNMRGFGSASGHGPSVAFDDWLKATTTASPEKRDALLAQWLNAPFARQVHPREEHLLPLMVVAGAAGGEIGRITFNEDWMSVRVSAVHFG